MKNSNKNEKIDLTKEKINENEDKNFEIIQSEENKEKRMKKSEESPCELYNTIKRNNLCMTAVPEEWGKKKGTEGLFKEIN